MSRIITILLFSVFLFTGSCRKKDGIMHNKHRDKPSVVLNKENKEVEKRGEKNYQKELKKRKRHKRRHGTYGME